MYYKSTDFTVGDIIQYTGIGNGALYGFVCIVLDIEDSTMWIRRTYENMSPNHIKACISVPIPKSHLKFNVRQKDVLQP